MKTMRVSLTFLTLAAGLSLAQPGNIAGPVAGYVFDRADGSLRPVAGIPGASVIGSPLDLGFRAAGAWVAPRLDSAVAVSSDGSLHFLRIDAGSVSELPFHGIDGRKPREVVFSPSGTSAALFAGSDVTIVTGLPGAPAVAGTVALPRVLPRPSRMPALHTVSTALSDDGVYLLHASGGEVQVYTTAGEHRKLADGVLAAFAPGGHDAAVADPAGTGVFLIHDIAAPGAQKVLAAAGDGFESPGGLAFSADGRTLFLASAGAHGIAAFDVASGDRSTIECGCTPASLVRMGNVFRLNELGAEPLWLLNAAASDRRVVFVPAVSAN